MAKQANPTLIGAFVMGAVVLLSTAVILFGGDTLFTSRERVIMYFDGSVDGLNVGAAVTVRGVKIGTVTGIDISFNTRTGDLKVPVIAEIEADSVAEAMRYEVEDPLTAIIEELGLRAQLQIQSYLTSQLFIQLDYYPGSELHYYGDGTMIEIPTVPMPIERFGKALDDISIEQMVVDISSSLSAISRLVNSPDITNALQSMHRAFESVDAVSTALNEEIVPLAGDAAATMTEVRQIMKDLGDTVAQLKQLTSNDATHMVKLNAALDEIRLAAEQVGRFEETPQMQKLEVALDEIAEAARLIRTMEDSPQMYNLNLALEEITTAARAVRTLADTLDRQPEILLRGRPEE